MSREVNCKRELLSDIISAAACRPQKRRRFRSSAFARAALGGALALLSSFLFIAGAQPEDFWLRRRPAIRVQNAPELASSQGRRLLTQAVEILYTACPGLSALTNDGAEMVISPHFSLGEMPQHALFGWDYYLVVEIRVLGGIRGAVSYALGAGSRPGISFVGYQSARFCTAAPAGWPDPFLAVPSLALLRALDAIELKSP